MSDAEAQARAVIREAVMEAARILHADKCGCGKVPGVIPPPPYRSSWVDAGISVAHGVLAEMEAES